MYLVVFISSRLERERERKIPNHEDTVVLLLSIPEGLEETLNDVKRLMPEFVSSAISWQ